MENCCQRKFWSCQSTAVSTYTVRCCQNTAVQCPIQWSIIDGEKTTGVTTMYMGEGLDTGDMILKKETPIGENETYGELHDRLAVIGAQALVETVDLLEQGKAPREKQDDALSCYAPMLDKKIAKLDFAQPATKLHDLIRGLSPWPVAHTTFEGKLLNWPTAQ